MSLRVWLHSKCLSMQSLHLLHFVFIFVRSCPYKKTLSPFYPQLILFGVREDTGAYPSFHLAKDRSAPHHRASQKQITMQAHTHTYGQCRNWNSWPNMHDSEGSRKKAHTCKERAWTLHIKRPQREVPSHCKEMVLCTSWFYFFMYSFIFVHTIGNFRMERGLLSGQFSPNICSKWEGKEVEGKAAFLCLKCLQINITNIIKNP